MTSFPALSDAPGDAGGRRRGADPYAVRQDALAQVLGRVEASLRRVEPPSPDFLGAIRHVIVVASSSRCGSSLLVELLKESTGLLHLSGELNPFLRLAGLAWPDSGCDSDALASRHCSGRGACVLQEHLAAEVGVAGGADPVAGLDDVFLERLYRRLCLQWPLEPFTIGAVRSAAGRALRAVERRFGRLCDWPRDLAPFHIFLLLDLKAGHPAINPYYYDLDRSLIKAMWPDVPVPAGAPSPIVIEEPPFVLIRPWPRWTPAALASRSLIVKTPSNAYRPDFLRTLFPSAHLRTIHLTRNPAASINGLYDGWRHWGFHSHYIGPGLQVPGYAGPGEPDHGWWKFDLPPGWRDYCRAPLERICGFQWHAAQQAILERHRSGGPDYLRLRFEDVLSGFKNCPGVLRGLRTWIGDEHLLARGLRGVQPVMSTHPPRPGRWRDNSAILNGVLNEEPVRRLAGELGYEDEAEWI